MIYGVCLNSQQQEIEKHCFGDCGKIIVGGFNIGALGFSICREIDCPHKERDISLDDMADDSPKFEGESVTVRRLMTCRP